MEEILADFKCKECIVKGNVFKSGNNGKLNFKFKPDSDIAITKILLHNVVDESTKDEIKNTIKYFIKDKNLDIDIIFNKKGKYQIFINYFDRSLFDGKNLDIYDCFKSINYFAIVESDAKEYKEFSDEEMLITQPFEDSLKFINFKYISHKNHKISSKDAENFEFELDSKLNGVYDIENDIYLKNTDSIRVKKKETKNRKIFYCTFDEDIKIIMIFNITIYCRYVSKFVYIISLSDYFKNMTKVRKNILATLDKAKIKKLVLSCKKRTQLSLNEFVEHFKEKTKNLSSAEKAYALFFWMCNNIAYDVNGYYSDNTDVSPEGVYRNGYGVCSGYSRLFKYIGTYIGLYVFCVDGYAKGIGYSTEIKISGTNHEWNIIKLDNVYYQIDSTWGAGSVNGRNFQKEFKEFYFCPEPEQLFATHFPSDPKWQLIIPSLSAEEFAKRVKSYSPFCTYFIKVDQKYHTIQVKNKTIIRFYKKVDKVAFSISMDSEKKRDTKDMKYLVKDKKDYVDLIYIFKHKGKYSTRIFANDGSHNTYDAIMEYKFESLEEWGNKKFDFSIDDYDYMDKLQLESVSHKDLEFKANNREKLTFKFKPDSKVKIMGVNLELDDDKYDLIKNVTKYYLKDKQLDVEVIFNKKGKYKLYLKYLDLNSKEENNCIQRFTYFPIVASDAKEQKYFSQEELLIHEPFEDSLNNIKLKYISQKNQNIIAKRLEKFEFECEDKDIKILLDYYPSNSKVITKRVEEKNKYIFYFAINEKKKILSKI